MSNILRIILFGPKPFGQNPVGIFQLSFGSQKPFTVIPNLNFHSVLNTLTKCSTATKCIQRHYSKFKDYRSEVLNGSTKPFTKFDELNLHVILNSSRLTEGVLVNTYKKILKTYYATRHKHDSDKNFISFLEQENFLEFCEALESRLPEFSESSLVALLDLKVLHVPTMSCLMQKVATLILDKFNDFTIYEKVYLYVKLSESEFSNIKEYQNLKKACEVYFNSCLEDDLDRCKFSQELLTFIKIDTLPESVRRSFAAKLLGETIRGSHTQQEMIELIRIISLSAAFLLPPKDILTLIRKCIYTCYSDTILRHICISYRNLIHRDESYFDEEIISVIALECLQNLHSGFGRLAIIQTIVLMGYYKKELIEFVCKFALSRNFRALGNSVCFIIASVLVRTSYFEIVSDTDIRNITRLLESVDPFSKNSEFDHICALCELLTYLGCDTRELCNTIFQTINNSSFKDTVENETSQTNVLPLHHLAKAYLSSGYEVLTDSTLDQLLKKELSGITKFSDNILEPYFDSQDYLLKGCTTSEKHCLHFVSLFGADNKPINLSQYRKERTGDDVFNIKEIERPEGSKMIAFQIFNDAQPLKYLNEPRMSGVAKMYLKLFETLDCSIVLLPPKYFKLPPKGQEEFLRSHINEILEQTGTQ